MKQRLAIAFVLLLAIALLTTAAVAAWRGDPLWKQECPPWGELKISQGLHGWLGVECYLTDAAEH